MNKEEQHKIAKGIEIAKELHRLVESKAEKSEIIEKFIKDHPAEMIVLSDRLDNGSVVRNAVGEFSNRNSEQEYDIFHRKLNKKMQVRRLRLISGIVTGVAAAVLAIFFNVYNIIPSNEKENIQFASVSAIDKPVIISGGNKIIALNDKKVYDKLNYVDVKKDNNRLIYSEKVADTVRYDELVIPYKSKYTVILADNSEITLNAGGRVRYPNRFVGHSRVVELEGEAYFKVSKSDKPFIVKSGEVEVQVYGTEFNINTKDEGLIETVLVSGSVGVRSSKAPEVKLRPNEMYSYNTKTKQGELTEVNVANYVSWLNGEIYSDNEPLSRLVSKISSWYGIEIVIADKELQSMPVTVGLDSDSDIFEIIDILKELTQREIIMNNERRFTVK